MIEYDNGIHLKETSLWFDARDPKELCAISHAHVDHLGVHDTIIASKPTHMIYEHRMRPAQCIELDYGQMREVDDLQITIYPAGHILGSSQFLVIKDGVRILYTGDFNVRPVATAEAIEIVSADILIMEATYGRRECLFEDRDIVVHDLCTNLRGVLEKKGVPLVVAYSLGKGQEMTKVLTDHGFDVIVHSSIYDLIPIYESFGISFSKVEKLSPGIEVNNKVVIVPPHILESELIKALSPMKTFLVSGWLDAITRYNSHIDKVFQISDHADFNELLGFVKEVNPKETYVVHGQPSFVNSLRDIGYKAEYLGNT